MKAEEGDQFLMENNEVRAKLSPGQEEREEVGPVQGQWSSLGGVGRRSEGIKSRGWSVGADNFNAKCLQSTSEGSVQVHNRHAV